MGTGKTVHLTIEKFIYNSLRIVRACHSKSNWKAISVKLQLEGLLLRQRQEMVKSSWWAAIKKVGLPILNCEQILLGRLGLGTKDNANPAALLSFKFKVANIACGYWHTLIRSTTGKVYGTGYNKSGGLGLGDTMNRDTFTEIPGFKGRCCLLTIGTSVKVKIIQKIIRENCQYCSRKSCQLFHWWIQQDLFIWKPKAERVEESSRCVCSDLSIIRSVSHQ